MEKKEEVKKEKEVKEVKQPMGIFEIYGRLMVDKEILDGKINEVKAQIQSQLIKQQNTGKK